MEQLRRGREEVCRGGYIDNKMGVGGTVRIMFRAQTTCGNFGERDSDCVDLLESHPYLWIFGAAARY